MAALLAAGCSTSTGITKPADISGSASTSASKTATSQPQVSSTLTEPHPPPNHWNDGTSYDPCLTYTADQIRSWGADPAKVGGPGRRGPSGSRVSLGSRWLVGGSDRGQHQGLFILRSRFVRQPSIHQGCRARCGHFSRWQRWGARLHGLSASTERFSWRRCRGVRSETCQGCA